MGIASEAKKLPFFDSIKDFFSLIQLGIFFDKIGDFFSLINRDFLPPRHCHCIEGEAVLFDRMRNFFF